MVYLTAILGILVSLPIWFFLLYSVLSAIHPDRLVWFLFWIYLPVTLASNMLSKLVELQQKAKAAAPKLSSIPYRDRQ